MVKQEVKRSQPGFMQRGAAGAGGMGGYGQEGAIPQSFHPIASLHPYHTRWTIKARVTAKGEKRSWNNAKGSGGLFSVDLLDAQGGQIKATMFKEAMDKFYDVFQENHVYIISKGTEQREGRLAGGGEWRERECQHIRPPHATELMHLSAGAVSLLFAVC